VTGGGSGLPHRLRADQAHAESMRDRMSSAKARPSTFADGVLGIWSEPTATIRRGTL
jgi:hypothetical protein